MSTTTHSTPSDGRGAELSPAVPRDTWRVVADDGRTYAASVLEPTARGDYHHARMTVATRSAEKRATTARRAVCLAALDLGLGVVEIRAPGELTKDDAVETMSRVACEAIEGA